jgi:hypothetical protein
MGSRLLDERGLRLAPNVLAPKLFAIRVMVSRPAALCRLPLTRLSRRGNRIMLAFTLGHAGASALRLL